MKSLKDYLRQNQAICFAFLFGSRARGLVDVHDWNLGTWEVSRGAHKKFATANVKDFKDLGFKRVFNPLRS